MSNEFQQEYQELGQPRKKHVHLSLHAFLEDLRTELPSPTIGPSWQGWRHFPMEERAQHYGISYSQMKRKIREAERDGYIQRKPFYGKNKQRNTKIKATTLLVEGAQEIKESEIEPLIIYTQKPSLLSTIDSSIEDIPTDLSVYEGYTLASSGFPQELFNLFRWVCWCYGAIREDGKPEKKLYSARKPGRLARSNDPSTWASYEEAQAHTQQKGYAGVAFALFKGLVFIDLDHCIVDGKISPQAQAIIAAINSYTELSPTDGVHILARGSILKTVVRKDIDIEMYDQSRFLTVTGKHLAGSPATIELRQAEIDAFYAEIAKSGIVDSNYVPVPGMCLVSDKEVLDKARNAENGPKFTLLFSNQWRKVLNKKGEQRYPTQSEAVLGLCALLAFWTNCDPEAIDRLFRQSEMYRQSVRYRKRWERKDYREGIIRKAIIFLQEKGGVF